MQIAREKVRIYALVPDTQAEGGAKKFYIVGRGSASGSIAFGYTNEEQKDITQAQSSQSINKGAWSIQITGKAETSDNVHNYITMNSIRGNTENLLMDVLIVFEYIHKRGEAGTALALQGKAVLPLTSIGGDGQAKIQIDGTLSTSGDLTIGSIELNACGLSGVYTPETDTYETTSFKAGDIETNLDPHTAVKEEPSQAEGDKKNEQGNTPTPSTPTDTDQKDQTGQTDQKDQTGQTDQKDQTGQTDQTEEPSQAEGV